MGQEWTNCVTRRVLGAPLFTVRDTFPTLLDLFLLRIDDVTASFRIGTKSAAAAAAAAAVWFAVPVNGWFVRR